MVKRIGPNKAKTAERN